MTQRSFHDAPGPLPANGPVLLIEPDPRRAIGLVRALSPLARVRLASGICDARAAVLSEPPELLLVSDRLAEGGLPAFLQARRQDASLGRLPLVAMISGEDESAEVSALGAGALACLPWQAGPSLVAARLSKLLDMLRSNAYWRRHAESDALTGLANRRQLDVVLHREWRRAQRLQRPMALLMVDLDHFKAYNDLHGHMAGDDCLREVARILLRSVRRPTDLVGRYGGEEFSVLLSETDGQGARVVADLLLNAVADRALPHGGMGAGPRVSVSIGGSAWEPGNGDPGVTALVQAADAALYDAKRDGRDGMAWRPLTGVATLPAVARRTLSLPPLFAGLISRPSRSH